jgi:hypothetical protein
MPKKAARRSRTQAGGGVKLKIDENKAMLAAASIVEAQQAHEAAVEEFLNPDSQRANVVGLAVGVKWTNGQPTGEPAVLVLVSQKLEQSMLRKADVVPAKLGGMQTDVLAVGVLFAGGGSPGVGALTLANRVRPVQGGYSVGHFKITAGTIATCVYDILPGGTVSPAAPGVGIPAKYYILSNNHVLADVNAGTPGDPILQPGPYDGGTNPADKIAALTRFVPIMLAPAVPVTAHKNLVDCAIAEGEFSDLSREVYWNGYVRGWRLKQNVPVGLTVKKTGRTTNFTTGRITAINATIDVNYGGGRVGRFRDQIVTTNMSAGGDSGSLVQTLDNVAVGLLFAGSSVAMIANQIENVRSLLRIEVAEQIL